MKTIFVDHGTNIQVKVDTGIDHPFTVGYIHGNTFIPYRNWKGFTAYQKYEYGSKREAMDNIKQ